jgi:hypothetical protein
MRKPITLTKENFVNIKNTYVYETNLSTNKSDKAKFAVSLLNYENGKWTYAFYGIDGGIMSIANGKVYCCFQDALEAVNELISQMWFALSSEEEV